MPYKDNTKYAQCQTTMIRVFEFSTWKNSESAKAAVAVAIANAKQDKGKKFTVAIGEWGVRTFLVLGATCKEEARAAAVEEFNKTPSDGWHEERVKVRDVTLSLIHI